MNLQEATIKKLLEAKQVGTLYHYTNLEGIRGIAKLNRLEGNYNRQSFTRRSDLLNKNWSVYNDVRITVDGDLLSERYKIKPTNQIYNRMEAEERIIIKQIDNFSMYVTEVIISKQSLKNYSNKFKKFPNFINNIKDKAEWEKIFKNPEDYDLAKFYDFDTNKFNIEAYWEDTINLCKKVFKNIKEV